ncbi:phage tail protein [Providencia stuartii]|uniref:phage tail protein n=1 Tax=Providencia stuartii TaxID=588 RepID=UPI0024B059C2
MEVFIWPVKPGMKTDFSPRIKEAQFGDGYAQRSPDGINHQLRKINVMLSLKPQTADEALLFLAKHGGYRSFIFQPIKSSKPIAVICKKWSSDKKALKTEISAEFEEIPLSIMS